MLLFDGLDDGFDAFWAIQQNRVDKKDAKKAWGQLRPSLELRATIIEAMAAQIRYRASKIERREWVPQWPKPATWIRHRRWEDELPLRMTLDNPSGSIYDDPGVRSLQQMREEVAERVRKQAQ